MKKCTLFLILSTLFTAHVLAGLFNTPKQLIKTTVDVSDPPNKAELHFVCPPTPQQPIEERNLYPVITNNLREIGVNLTSNIKEAKYLVIWGIRIENQRVNSLRYMPDFSTTYGTMNSGTSYGSFYGTTSGGSYVPYSSQLTAKIFSIKVRHVVGENFDDWPDVWKGASVAWSNIIKDQSLIIESILSRYGTTFKGNVPLNEGLKIRKQREKQRKD